MCTMWSRRRLLRGTRNNLTEVRVRIRVRFRHSFTEVRFRVRFRVRVRVRVEHPGEQKQALLPQSN